MPNIFDKNLLPCPFCGGNAEWEYTPWNEESRTGDDGTGWIECQSCHIQMTGYDREDAERRWNSRHNGGSELTERSEGPAGA